MIEHVDRSESSDEFQASSYIHSDESLSIWSNQRNHSTPHKKTMKRSYLKLNRCESSNNKSGQNVGVNKTDGNVNKIPSRRTSHNPDRDRDVDVNKSTGNMESNGSRNTSKAVYCRHCFKYFPDYITLNEHLLNELQSQDKKDGSDEELESDTELPAVDLIKKGNTQNTLIKLYKCKLCGSDFPTQYASLKHREDKHPLTKNWKIFEKIFVTSPIVEPKHTGSVSHKETQGKRKSHDPEKDGERKKVKISKTKPNIDMPNDIIYKCDRCALHFLSTDNITKHITLCNKDEPNGLSCDVCSLQFHTSDLKSHKRYHHCNDSENTSGQFEIIQVSLVQNGNRNKTKQALYKCKVCNIHFVKALWLRDHLSSNKHNDLKYLCLECKFEMCEESFKIHLETHHGKMKLNRKCFHVTTNCDEESDQSEDGDTDDDTDKENSDTDVTENDTGDEDNGSIPEGSSKSKEKEDKRNDHQRKNVRCNKKTCNCNIDEEGDDNMSEDNSNSQHTETEDECENIPKQINPISNKKTVNTANKRNNKSGQKPDNDKRQIPDEDRTLYKCAACDVHDGNWRHIRIHIREKACTEVRKPNYKGVCDVCTLKFTVDYLPRHIKVHHKLLKLKRSEFIIKTYNNYTKEQSTNNTTSDNTRKKVKDKDKHNYVNNKSEQINPYKTLYKCGICNIHYIKHSSIQKHVKAGKHDPNVKVVCDKCDLIFTIDSLKYHKMLHHDLKNLTPNDLKILTF